MGQSRPFEINSFKGQALQTLTSNNQGLYDSNFEHDACGVALVATLNKKATHEIVASGLEALRNLEHRGASGSEPDSGDGAGILIQIPDEFLRDVVDFELPKNGHYAVGIVFLPQDKDGYLAAKNKIAEVALTEQINILGWREVPTNSQEIGKTAKSVMPRFEMIFIQPENKELKDSIMLLIGNITYLSKQNNQIFLCGHSMGSVLAMYTGYLMYTGKYQFKHAFLNNCYIFGSASAKWMLNESVWKSKQSNIYQFISCELRVNKTKKRLLVDCYQLEGDNEFILYPYFYYIFTENENNFMIESDSNKMNDYSIEYTAKNSQQCQKLHRWAFYVSLLQKQNSLPQKIDLNSNNTSVSRSKTYSVYRNRKKISNMSKTRNNRE